MTVLYIINIVKCNIFIYLNGFIYNTFSLFRSILFLKVLCGLLKQFVYKILYLFLFGIHFVFLWIIGDCINKTRMYKFKKL